MQVYRKIKKAAVVSSGWMGDSIVCSSVASALYDEKKFDVDFYTKWPQLKNLLDFDDRYKTYTYNDNFFSRTILNEKLSTYDLVIREPINWSYEVPKTVEMKILAGCIPTSEYIIKPPPFKRLPLTKTEFHKIAISKDIYKKSYGRDIGNLIEKLETIYQIAWVGLDSNKSSKHGKKSNLVEDVLTILDCDFFFGPEGGMLWLAGGLGIRTAYLTEHIQHWKPINAAGDCWMCLGSANMFPNGNHLQLPPYCSNDIAFGLIKDSFPI